MIDLHSEIQNEKEVYNWRDDMISFFRSSIIEYDEIHIEKAESIHKLLPCT